jgi:uncharacterized membrane protein
MTLNLIVVTLFTINLLVQFGQLEEAVPSPISGVVLSALGVTLLLLSGYFGWTLVQKHHVGVDLTHEQQQLDRAQEARIP